MKASQFPNPKLNLPKELRDLKDDANEHAFKAIDGYLGLIEGYIYTDINLDYVPSDPNHIHAWIQRTMSALLLRSLYIRNAFVEAMNARNAVAIYLPLKAWLETVGALAWLLDLLEKGLSPDVLFKEMQPFVLGNKGKGNLRVGENEAKNVLTMLQKADKYITKMKKESTKHGVETALDTFFTDYYDVASNPSHPSFDAYEIVGCLGDDDGMWHAHTPDETKKTIVTDIPGYGGLLSSPLFIKNLCDKLYKIEKPHFDRLKSKKYFE